jgi:hypothetical protein
VSGSQTFCDELHVAHLTVFMSENVPMLGFDPLPDVDWTAAKREEQWWTKFVKEEDKTCIELSGKLVLLFEILSMAQQLGDKVYVFDNTCVLKETFINWNLVCTSRDRSLIVYVNFVFPSFVGELAAKLCCTYCQ